MPFATIGGPQLPQIAEKGTSRVTSASRPLITGFLRSAKAHPDREALRFLGRTLTYADLHAFAAGLAATLQRHGEGYGSEPVTAVLGRKSVLAYGGLLAALMRGHAYLPLNPKYPAARLRTCLERCGAGAILVAEEGETLLPELVGEEPRVWVLPHREDVSELEARWPAHRWIGASGLEPASRWSPPETTGDDLAYVLFTSGSTGEPKGVMVAQRNVTAMVDAMTSAWEVSGLSRFAQMPETSFDAAVMDIWMAWEHAGALCVPSDLDLLKIDEFIIREAINYFLFVPSAASMMHRLGKLQPGRFPSLRVTVFGGEVFPQPVAEAWAAASPNCRLENHYGPTEVTVTCLTYPWREESPSECVQGGLPIGWPVSGMEARVVDASGREVDPGESGELWMAGPQVSLGYWKDPERTAAAFTTLEGVPDRIFYRTGDRVVRPVGDAPFQFLGRFDDQYQIRGHRVELNEIEGVLREAAGVTVSVVAWPETAPGAADGVVAFVEAESIDIEAVSAAIAERLPPYMHPRRYITRESLPLTENGKVDRKRLRESLAE